jgi:hypothetical protein
VQQKRVDLVRISGEKKRRDFWILSEGIAQLLMCQHPATDNRDGTKNLALAYACEDDSNSVNHV